MVILLAVALFGLIVPTIASDARDQDLDHVLSPPGVVRPFGTDHLGRDMMARLSSAARLSLGLALLSVGTAAIPGTLLGIVSAWRGGWLESVLAAISDGVLALPGILLVVLIAAFSPGHYLPFYIGLSLALWVEYFRVTRASAKSVLASAHVEAAKLLGFGPSHIVRRHLAPELLPIVVTLLSFGIAATVLSLATLGIVGVGLQPPTPELGIMMIELLPYYREAPWLIAQPILLLVITVVALSMITFRRRIA